MTELMEGGGLKRADIVLTHYKRSLWGWLIRLATGCYWNHALIVYVVRDLAQEWDKTLVIDPRMGGIYLSDIAHYLERPDRYDIAVKRLKADWFQSDREADGLPYCKTVCDILLRETDDRYDAKIKRLIRRTRRQITLGYRFAFKRRKHRRASRKQVLPFAMRLKISTYSCGGLVQWGYYQGVSRVLGDCEDKTKLQEIIFNPRLVEPVTQYDLLSTTPADLARSDKLAWKYFVKDGEVWEVSSEEEVNSILMSGKGQR